MIQNLSSREKSLIGLMGAILLVFLAFLGFKFIQISSGGSDDQLNLRIVDLQQIRKLRQEWEQLNSLPEIPTSTLSLITILERTANSFQLKDSLQLNELPSISEGLEGVQVKLENLNLDQVFHLLYFLENYRPVILIEPLEVSRLPNSDVLRVSFRAYKQKR